MQALALIVADPAVGRLGHARRLDTPLAGVPVLRHTLDRAARIAGVSRLVVIHPPNTNPLDGLDLTGLGKPVEAFAHPLTAGNAFTPRTRSARKWALSAWRGGLGGATAWDELLPAEPLADALEAFQADAAAIVGGDWCVFDPAIADALLKLHLAAPEGMKLTFTQAPPGVSPIVTSRAVLRDLADKHAGFGTALSYNPHHPSLDPIGREVNLPIHASVRDTARRFIFDTPSGQSRLQHLAEHEGDRFADADAVAITDACRAWELAHPEHIFDDLPEQITIELTPRRLADGPITPQHHVKLDRGEIDLGLAREVLAQCRGKAVTLGGLGDATLHPQWTHIADAAHDAGVFGLHLETDLLAQRDQLAPLVDDDRTDIVSVRINADTAATYAKVMGCDRLPGVMETLQWLFDRRSQRGGSPGMPWIIPRLVKTADTLKDMETFFERWMQVIGHAVIERSPLGGTGSFALMPDLSPVPMATPWKPPSPHQVKRRLTVLSDGSVTLCSQDWLGRASLGNAREHSLLELWQQAADAELPGEVDDSPVCRRCHDWWSLRRVGVAAAAAG